MKGYKEPLKRQPLPIKVTDEIEQKRWKKKGKKDKEKMKYIRCVCCVKGALLSRKRKNAYKIGENGAVFVGGEQRDVGEPPMWFYDASSWEGVEVSSHGGFAQKYTSKDECGSVFSLTLSSGYPHWGRSLIVMNNHEW